jgi:hypothetical protein
LRRGRQCRGENDDGLDEKRVLFSSLCTFLTIYAIFMAAVAYCKMNNICDEEGEANGGVFVGDSIVSIFRWDFLLHESIAKAGV